MNKKEASLRKKRGETRRSFLKAAGVGTAALAWQGAVARQGRVLRLAVVGGGFGAAHHWHEHPRCRITAVSDLVPERRRRLQERYRCRNAYRSLEEMLEKAAGTFDAVAIFTDAPSHAKHTVMCMKAGKHVVSACPVGLSLEELREVKRVKEETGLLYMMHESSYYRQECIAARELYEAGAFGRLCYSEVEYYHPGIGRRNHSLSVWRGKRTWRWGFPPLLYPTHSLGLIVGVTKERIVKVSAYGEHVSPDFPGPQENSYGNPFDNEMALGFTDKGNICRFGVFWSVAAEGERGQWLGEKLSCYMPSSGGQPAAMKKSGRRWEPWRVPRYWETDRLPPPLRHPSGHGGSSVFLCNEFIEAVLGEREPAVDVYESIAMTAPGIVAHASALKGGVQLSVPSFDPR